MQSRTSQKKKNSKAYFDFKKGLAMYPIWWGLAWKDIKQRYSRSLIGPFWITLSTGAMVAAMGPIYSTMLGQDVTSYVQYLAISLVIWQFISSTFNEAGAIFTGAEGYIKQISLPFSIFVLRLISKNILMLVHNALVIFIVLAIYPPEDWRNLFWAPIGLLLIVLNLIWIVLFIGMLSARFRDIPQLVINLVQVSFFLSPVLWRADMLSLDRRFLADYNPLYHFMEVLRAPLLGEPVSFVSSSVCVALLIIGGVSTFLFFAKLRARIPYWI